MRSLLTKLLFTLTRRILERYQPLVVGITGSVGKTTAKEALAHILSVAGKQARKSTGSFNTEIGVPLTVIGVDRSPGKSVMGWLTVLSRGVQLLAGDRAHYPAVLVLEMGADRPGDIEQLVRLTKPAVGMLTAVGPAHLERFGDLEGIIREKKKIVTLLPKTSCAIIPSDEPVLHTLKKEVRARVLTVGATEGSDVRVSDVRFICDPQSLPTSGTYCKLGWQGSSVPCFLPGVLGLAAARSAGFAAAAAFAMDVGALTVSEALRTWMPPPGRMRIIPGIKDTVLIDDSYNSSPKAAAAALEAVSDLGWRGRRYVVFGDMAELGKTTREEHERLGALIAEHKPDCFVAVGPTMVEAVRAARASGMEESSVFHFADTQSAGLFVQERLHPGDLVLIKGSQVMRMERIVKELMAEPLKASELLVRQGEDWKNK